MKRSIISSQQSELICSSSPNVSIVPCNLCTSYSCCDLSCEIRLDCYNIHHTFYILSSLSELFIKWITRSTIPTRLEGGEQFCKCPALTIVTSEGKLVWVRQSCSKTGSRPPSTDCLLLNCSSQSVRMAASLVKMEMSNWSEAKQLESVYILPVVWLESLPECCEMMLPSNWWWPLRYRVDQSCSECVLTHGGPFVVDTVLKPGIVDSPQLFRFLSF